MLTARLILSNNMRINLNISDMHMTLVCPGIRQRAPFSALIKPIGLCGTQNAQNFFEILKTEHVVVFQDTLKQLLKR